VSPHPSVHHAREPVAARASPPSGATGRARLIRTQALAPKDLDAWGRLADRAAEANPFFGPDFVLSATEGRGEDAVLLVVTHGEDWIACMPVRPALRWRGLPLPCLAPWLPEYTFLATPLVDRDRLALATATMSAFVAGQRRFAALVLDPLDPSGAVGGALIDAFAPSERPPIVQADFERAALRRRAEPTYLEEALSGKKRKELRRLRRVLARQVGDEPQTVDRSVDPAACDDFLGLEREGWKGERGTALASRPGDAAFFRRLCRALAGRGRLQILALEADGRTLAMQCNLLDGDCLFGFKVAYDEDWARFSPGVLLEVDAIEAFHERVEARTFDSCTAPDNELLNRLWPDRRRLQTVLVPTGAPLAALLRPAARGEAGARRLRRYAASRRTRSG